MLIKYNTGSVQFSSVQFCHFVHSLDASELIQSIVKLTCFKYSRQINK